MAYPYKKMTSEDFDYIRSVTASDRVWVGDAGVRSFSSGALCGGFK